MRVLFAGFGSIATRHIANLRTICTQRCIDLEIDLLRHASAPLPEGIRASFTSSRDVDESYDAVFVTNPTSMHYDMLLSLLDKSECFFIEKPVFDSTDVDVTPFERPNKLFYVACPLRYTSVLRWAKENIDFSRAIALRCISSSYLPDWRPNQDYRDTYSAHANLGGGVHIDLIHEWDYICHLVGLPSSVHSFIARRSQLDIDSPDVALYVADYGDKTVELHLDYYGRATVRKMEVFTDEDTIVCDLARGCVDYLKSGNHVDLSEERNDFQRLELEHFLDACQGSCQSENDINEALSVLAVARGELG